MRFRYPVLPRLAALTATAPIDFTVYVYETPATAVVSEYVSTAPIVVICAATPAPIARHTWYPVAPVDAVHVTLTPVVRVPSVAATLSGALNCRYPASPTLAALTPTAPVAFTEYVYKVPVIEVVSEYDTTAPTVPICAATPAPIARHTWYPVAPDAAVHVTFTPVVRVPSVASTFSGALNCRYPVFKRLYALMPTLPTVLIR